MSEDKPSYDVAQAQAAIEADKRLRAEAAAAEIREVLARHNCELVAVPQLTADGRVAAVVQVVAQ